MKKETVTLGAIKKDLLNIVREQIDNKSSWRLSYIVPITLLAVLLGVCLNSVIVGLVIFAVPVYHIVWYVVEIKKYKENKASVMSMLERGDVSISLETFSHVATETVYEPHTVGRRIRTSKTVIVYYFKGSASWRVPNVDKHYSWSSEFYLSSKGLDNITLAGDEFFFVRLQNHSDIAYVYPCKCFELDASLKK